MERTAGSVSRTSLRRGRRGFRKDDPIRAPLRLRHVIWPSISLIVLVPAGIAHAANLFDFTGSGSAFTGWTWVENVDGYGSPGWKRDDAKDVGGGGDWRPRTFVKNDSGEGTRASIDPATRAPSTATGGSLKLVNPSANKTASWWGFMPQDTYARMGVTSGRTNRFGYYARYHGMQDPGLRSSDPENGNVEIGTYLFPPGDVIAGNEIGHWYHLMDVVNDVWLHVVLDRHPQHERGGEGAPPDDPAGPEHPYYRDFASFYWDIPYPQGRPTTVWFDDVGFWTQPGPENDVSVSTTWVGYRATDRRWMLSFNDSSWGSAESSYNDRSVGTYEVRWSREPITNANWSRATPIVPLVNGARGPGRGQGRIRRPNPSKQIAYTDFRLPRRVVRSARTVYFAIKDVSSARFGDGHDSPSPHVKTIDYALRSSR